MTLQAKKKYSTLRLILGDQLNASHSWYRARDEQTLYLIAELHQEASYTLHHKQKIAAFFAAMQQFAQALESSGHEVLYLNLDDTSSFSDLPALLDYLIDQYRVDHFEHQLPDEYRLREQLANFRGSLSIPSCACSTEHFYLPDEEIGHYFQPQKRHRMENFYRKIRQRFNVLMDSDKPRGGKWNYDANNRNKLKATDLANVPAPLLFSNNVSSILARIDKHKITTIGHADTQLIWPVNRAQATQLLNYFCEVCLPRFGQFQDAMTGKLTLLGEDHGWSLYHSRLSFALNAKLLSPAYVVNTAIAAFEQSNGEIEISQIEGFVRQIIGWREFIRGIYWANMPDYASLNALDANRQLPSWFWTGDTKMNCLQHAIKQSLHFAYAHHIQRLMVTGNFCLLTGIDPALVDRWYLGIYIDAIEWVEMPNTRGMSQFADGGIVGSKAYAASGNYINKMSDYCSDCIYNVSNTIEDDACPLNSLYWQFMHSHQLQMGNNPRTKLVFSSWLKKSEQQRIAVLDKAKHCLNDIENL
ncbi:cryptochrome/photolyase family protein [Agarivorans litoreus]|uniref:cryptochrome/photolyase family protein n=1 Tax=Agarivorans litoreus TaxID=1510455 RepID=UPI001C7D6D46|nr:cryptochrome/photolyase family protein [Agarivorans litoreus]